MMMLVCLIFGQCGQPGEQVFNDLSDENFYRFFVVHFSGVVRVSG
jgi:hypothetical protein